MAAKRVALTGLGLITPFGVGVDLFWDSLLERRTAVRRPERFETDDMPATHYAEVAPVDFDEYLDPKGSALWSDVSKLAVVGGLLAGRDAGIESFPATRTGVIVGTGYGCSYEFEPVYDTWARRGWKRLKPTTVPRMMANAPASHLGIAIGARGVNFTVSTACSSGAIAAGLAAQQIRAGVIDVCVTGGFDYLLNTSIAGAWNALRVLSRQSDAEASRPFSADRGGLVLGEGCAMIVLEEWESALRRGARIYAELTGVGATNDAANIVGPDVQGEVEAIRMALADAGLTTDEIDHVNAHGTGTRANDANETAVLKEVFGDRARGIPVTSIKGHLGHTMGAAGAAEIAATALALKNQVVPPTLHVLPGDPDCDLDYVADGPRPTKLRHALTNSFGFGGQNSVLALSRAETD